jgi:hypothetical protein
LSPSSCPACPIGVQLFEEEIVFEKFIENFISTAASRQERERAKKALKKKTEN